MSLITEEFHLLGQRLSGCSAPYRPPWAIAERHFIQTCDQCGACIEACPEHILVYGRGDYPQVDFSKGGCTFCGECTRACKPGGLLPADTNPWHLKAFIAATCLGNKGTECNSCSESCPARAISSRRPVGNTAVPIVEEMLCNGCGACVSACPVSAIRMCNLF